MGEDGGVHWQPHQRNGVAVALVVASLGCATTYPRTVDPEAERAKVMAYLAKRKVNPDTLVVYLEETHDHWFGYLLVIGDEAVQGLTRGKERRVRLTRTGLGPRLAGLTEQAISGLRDAEPPIGIDGGYYFVMLRRGGATKSYSYWSTVPVYVQNPESALIGRLEPYLEYHWPSTRPRPAVTMDR